MQEQASINTVAVVIDELPDMARQLVDLIGLANTFTLIEKWGGTTFPVAAGKHALGRLRYDALAEAVGVQAADKLTQEYGCTRLYIPQCAVALRQARNRAICAEFDQLIAPGNDTSSNDAVFLLARKYKISDRLVWQILKTTDMNGGNGTNKSCQFSLL